jgi:transposase
MLSSLPIDSETHCGRHLRQRDKPLADNPFYTKRFAFYIGRRCRSSSIQDVAKEHFLDWRTVKTLEMQYMRGQIKRAGQPRPKVIGIDEISIRKGQTYRIVVTDLDRRQQQERTAELERKLGLNSDNSGKPPSSDGLKKSSGRAGRPSSSGA